MVGQGIAGKLARPDRLRGLMTTILLVNVPCLIAMSLAEGKWRLFAACTTGLFHFMHQPVFNSFLAQLVPRRRRSVGYGFSQMMQFGLGGLGAVCRVYQGIGVAGKSGLRQLRLAGRRRTAGGWIVGVHSAVAAAVILAVGRCKV